jgi:hypothetical protein
MHTGTGQHPLRKHVFSYDQPATTGTAGSVISEGDDEPGEYARSRPGV